jgi:hypothetical protein
MADDAVQPGQVGTKVRKHDYDFTCKMSGGNVVMGSGKWTGASIKDHPDFAWYPQQQRSENPEVKYDVVCSALKVSSPRGGRNSRKEPDAPVERPPAVPDVENPPHAPEEHPVVPMPPALQAQGAQEKMKASAISATDLLVLIANKTSSFDLFCNVNGLKPVIPVGDPLVITGSSGKEGYLYLFLIHDQTGEVKMLFPLAQKGKDDKLVMQDNRVPKGAFEFGGKEDKNGIKFSADVIGPQRIKALVTSRPLVITGLNMSSCTGSERQSPAQQNPAQAKPEEKPKGQSQDFSWHPTQQEVFKETIQKLATNSKKLTIDQVGEVTGVDPRIIKELGDFAQAEPAFYVQPAGGKPPAGNDKPPADKTDKPAQDKTNPDKPKIGTDEKPKDKPADDKSKDKPADDKSKDKPATDKPSTDKPKDKPN